MGKDFSYGDIFGQQQGGVDLVKSAQLFKMSEKHVRSLENIKNRLELQQSQAFHELLGRMKKFQRFVGFVMGNGRILYKRVEKDDADYSELKRNENDEFIKPHHPESEKPEEAHDDDKVFLTIEGIEFPKGKPVDYAEVAEQKFGLNPVKVENEDRYRVFDKDLAFFVMRLGLLPDTSITKKPDENGLYA